VNFICCPSGTPDRPGRGATPKSTALERAARSLDHVVAGLLDGDGGRQRLIDADVAVTQSQLVIIAAALQATTSVFDALGASGVSEELLLDRHWRNARTLGRTIRGSTRREFSATG
jgi:alkylation response protein AidB-like acyl-CoA dehydrogenase